VEPRLTAEHRTAKLLAVEGEHGDAL
jgi:hypothetical protein